MESSRKNPKRKKIALELMHQRLGHRYTRSLIAGDTENFWEDIDLRIYPDPFGTSCKIYSMNKKARSKLPLKTKAPFKWFFMDIIPSTAPKSLTNDTNFKNYLLIVDAYSKISKLYGMKNITTAEVMDTLDMFQSRFGKIDQFVHDFCSNNIFHSIKFWYLRISIKNQQIILEISVIGEALGCC